MMTDQERAERREFWRGVAWTLAWFAVGCSASGLLLLGLDAIADLIRP